MRGVLFLALLTAAATAAAAQAGAGVTTRQTAPALSLLVCESPQAQQAAEPSAKRLAANGTTIRYWEQGAACRWCSCTARSPTTGIGSRSGRR
jgi:hypothetical protein